MVDSKAGGVPVGGAQGTANAGASEFSGANFTYVKVTDGANTDHTAAASTGTDGILTHLYEWAAQKGQIVVMNGQTGGVVDMIFEGPFGWGNSAAMQVSLRADDPTSVSMSSATTAVSTALVLG
tara:strand:+ start:54 stop:425 length:372 start_codon:yes stop_codon:yes gene_type:complete